MLALFGAHHILHVSRIRVKVIRNYDDAGWFSGDAHSLCLGGVRFKFYQRHQLTSLFFIGFPQFL